MDDFAKRIEALSTEKRELLEIFLKEKKIDTDWLKETYVAPRGPVEQTLAEIWAQVLGVERVGIQDNFFELGGDSILSIQIIAKAGESGMRIHRNHLFEHPTIAELAPLTVRSEPPPAEEGAAAGPVPLAPAQRLLLAEGPEPGARLVLLEAREADAGLLERALRALMARHDALRLRFERSGGEWQQLSGEPADVLLTRQDLAHLPATEHAAAAREAAERLRGGWDLSRPPLLRLHRLDRGEGRPAWLLFAVHPLICDAESFRILFQELQKACGQLGRGGEIALAPPSTSFRSWCQRLDRYAASPELARELDWWLAQAEPPAPELPRDAAGGEGEARPVEVSLDEEETRALLEEIPAVHRTQVTDLLLTALVEAVTAWTGGSAARLELEGSARAASLLDADLSRTVGACGFSYPVQLSLAGASSPAAALRAVKEQLREVPEHGLGYGLLAGGAGPEGAAERLRALPGAPILVTYRPQLATADDGPFQLAGEPLAAASTERPPRPLMVTAGVEAGHVRVSFEYRPDLHRRSTVEGLAARFAGALRELIAACRSGAAALTPSDFPEAGLDQGDLDRLFGR